VRGFLGTGLALAVAAACGPVDLDGGAAGSGASADAGAIDAGASGVAGPAPGIQIASPADGEACKTKHHGSCPFSVAVTGAALAAPGRCGGVSPCGHVDLYVDGTQCGSPNAQAGTSDVQADFSRCPKEEGNHAVLCELRDDRGNLLARSQVVNVRVGKGDDEEDD
jgi:hypothetical protein